MRRIIAPGRARSSETRPTLPPEVQEVDHLDVYLKEITEHELLTPEQERELSSGIQGAETRAWESLLANPDIVKFIAEFSATLEPPIKLTRLRQLEARMAEPGSGRTMKRRARTVEHEIHAVAVALRAQDLDGSRLDSLMDSLGSEGMHSPALREAALARREGMRLRSQFITANLRLVVTMARRYDRGGLPLADLIQEGNLGLMHAVSRFDHKRGMRFSTYGCWWIRHAIGRALADKSRIVRIPVHTLEAQQKVENARQRLTGELGRPPTNAEISAGAKVKLPKIEQMQVSIMGAAVSTDRPVHVNDYETLGETLQCEFSMEDLLVDPETEDSPLDDELTSKVLLEKMRKFMSELSPLEISVLSGRFGLRGDERTLKEIGDEHGMSRERIRQVQAEALEKIRRAMRRDGVMED